MIFDNDNEFDNNDDNENDNNNDNNNDNEKEHDVNNKSISDYSPHTSSPNRVFIASINSCSFMICLFFPGLAMYVVFNLSGFEM